MLFSTSSMAVLGFAACASAHMKMSKPVPYANAQLNNSPLDATGSDFPCKNLYDTTTAATSMALGSKQTLAFIGGATHGGGSCQVSITYDNPPTKNSVFKVIHSIEGGCPTRNNAGNIGSDAGAADPDTYSFTIPTTIPTGKATIAWTWFNKVGNREMYMNCGPIDINGGSSKRSEGNVTQLMERDQSAFNALPNMFTANIGNGCHTPDSTDLLFPNPGDSVEKAAATPVFASPSGTCQTAGAAAGGGGAAPSSGAAAQPTPSPAQPTGSPGGVFATVAGSNPTTMAVAPSAAPSAAPSPAPSSGGSSSSSGASGTMTAGSACSTDGMWNCIGGTSYQQCASGMWSVVMPLATGTKCTPGQSSSINITAARKKRVVRFSSEHVRRRGRRGHKKSE